VEVTQIREKIVKKLFFCGHESDETTAKADERMNQKRKKSRTGQASLTVN
jgi:hypothetical protein